MCLRGGVYFSELMQIYSGLFNQQEKDDHAIETCFDSH